MRKIAIIMCLFMMTAGLSGCIGGTDVETDEGDDVELGELTDDWPTYYVPTAADLPTCDATTLGRLYYVEADTNFQACTSTGWTVVQIGGSSSTLVLNSAPVVSASVWYTDDDMIADDGDGTYSRLMYLDWSAMDLDGTIASLGLDYDSDGIIDIPFSGNSGLFSDQTPVLAQDGDLYGGSFIVPFEVGNNYIQVEDYDVPCAIIIQKTIVVIATDDDGATTYVPLVMDGVGGWGESYYAINGFDAQGHYASIFDIPQSNIDWVSGIGSSCPQAPQFSVVDHADPLTTLGDDNLVTITLDNAGDWSTFLSGSNTGWGDDHGYYLSVYCIQDNGNKIWLEGAVSASSFTGNDIELPQSGDYWTVMDSGGTNGVNSDCNPATEEVEVKIYFGDNQITLLTTVS